MADLAGRLEFLSPRDLLLLLGNRRSTGVLTLRQNEREKHLYIRDSAVVRASSQDPREYLGQILIHWGHLEDDAFHRAYDLHKAEGVPLADILVREKLVPEPIVLSAQERKIVETALDIYTWREGEFRFTIDSGLEREEGNKVFVPLGEVVRRGEERVREWRKIRADLPGGDVRLVLAGEGAPEAEPNTLDARIFRFLQQPKTVDELVLELHALEFLIYQRLWHLLRQGKILREDGVRTHAAAPAEPQPPVERREEAPQPAPKAEPAKEDGSPAELLAGARAAMEEGRLAEAVDLATRAVERSTTNEAVAFLRRAEKELVAQLRQKLLAQKTKPRVLLDRAQIRAMPLRPPERFLLGRMDGTRELASLLKVAPLREVDSLRLVQRLTDEGLIRY